MRKKYKNRKELVKAFEASGLKDAILVESQTDSSTGKKYPIAINPLRRAVKSALKLTNEQQKLLIKDLYEQRAKLNSELENG